MRPGLLTLILVLLALPAHALPLERYAHDPALARQARAIAREAAEGYLFRGIRPAARSGIIRGPLGVPGGAFVTFTLDGRTRGCWGTVYPQQPSLADEIRVAAVKALRYDYRHTPISRSEWPRLQLYVSLVGPLVPMASLGELSVSRDGLLVTTGDRGGVLLPGEARTARYMLAECLKKAGLAPRAPYQMFRFPTVVYGPESEAP